MEINDNIEFLSIGDPESGFDGEGWYYYDSMGYFITGPYDSEVEAEEAFKSFINDDYLYYTDAKEEE